MADPDEAPRAKRPIGAWVALGIVAVAVPLLVWAARGGTLRPDPPRDPLELSDRDELRAVVEAVSGVIRAGHGPDEDHAVDALVALHPRSPGATDLRDSCAATYGGLRDSQRLLAQMQALVPSDGGRVVDADRERLRELLTRSERLVTEAGDARNRCVGLYEQAAGRLHIAPAQRGAP